METRAYVEVWIRQDPADRGPVTRANTNRIESNRMYISLHKPPKRSTTALRRTTGCRLRCPAPPPRRSSQPHRREDSLEYEDPDVEKTWRAEIGMEIEMKAALCRVRGACASEVWCFLRQRFRRHTATTSPKTTPAFR